MKIGRNTRPTTISLSSGESFCRCPLDKSNCHILMIGQRENTFAVCAANIVKVLICCSYYNNNFSESHITKLTHNTERPYRVIFHLLRFCPFVSATRPLRL